MSTYQILTLCGVTSIVGLFIELLIRKPLVKRMAKAETEQETQKTQNNAIMLGVQALLRDRLLQAYRYYSHKGFASYDEKQNIINLYTQYEALGPNSVMDRLHLRFLELPEEPTENKGGNAA